MNERHYRLIFLGAGFSQPAGLPTGDELWEVTLNRILDQGQDTKFYKALETYCEYQNVCHEKDIGTKDVDFEEFLAFLEVEFYLGLRGGDTWSYHSGNETQVFIKSTIGDILQKRTPSTEDIPNLYLEFAQKLKPGDHIITFNYDNLLEKALDKVGKAYRLFPQRYEEVGVTSNIVDNNKEEIVILKVHGSIDWFNQEPHQIMREVYSEYGLEKDPEHPVFNTDRDLTVNNILEGPREENDPLLNMYRVKEIEKVYEKKSWFKAPPWILPPSEDKLLHSVKVKEFWNGLGQEGGYNLGCAVIGFSLSKHDEYVRQILWRIITNYQNSWWDEEFHAGLRKTPLALVDKRETKSDKKNYKEQYNFVDWERTKTCLNGFNKESLEIIFATRKE